MKPSAKGFPLLSMSAWVTVHLPVQVIAAPGASDAAGTVGEQVRVVNESVTVTLCSVWVPVLVNTTL